MNAAQPVLVQLSVLWKSRRFRVALLLATASAMIAARMTNDGRCRWIPEAPRVLDLRAGADATHLAVDRSRAATIAEAFADREDRIVITVGNGRDAREFAKTRHVRAAAYCRALMEEAIGRIHGLATP